MPAIGIIGELKNIMVEVTTKETKLDNTKYVKMIEYTDTNIIPLDLVNIKDFVLNGMIQFDISCVFLDGCTWKIR